MRKTLLVGAFVAVAGLGGFVAPVAAQDATQAQLAVPQVGEAKLKTLAALHRELITVREDFQAKLGRVHEEQAQDVLREELATAKAALHTKHAITEPEYQQLIFVVSVDPAQREVFEAALAELAGGNAMNGV